MFRIIREELKILPCAVTLATWGIFNQKHHILADNSSHTDHKAPILGLKVSYVVRLPGAPHLFVLGHL